ncbi:MAG: helix-turn-helix transcriptional regulator [Armatimonadetes bacterium]|nr:helix-turn-helix transcriptional regulator [Armatimonadota bacterium]
MNRLRKPQSRSLQTRESLLRAAELVFAKVGYERAQMEEIAAAAGYSKGGLYAHFKSARQRNKKRSTRSVASISTWRRIRIGHY